MNALAQALKKQGVQEMRFLFCQQSQQSQGLRSFLQTNFTPLKQEYAKLPLLVREANGQQPMIIARFPFGVERGVSVANKTPAEITASLQKLITETPAKP